MTEEELEEVHNLKERIAADIHDLVDRLTRSLDLEIDYEVRQQLTEGFRFWRRMP